LVVRLFPRTITGQKKSRFPDMEQLKTTVALQGFEPCSMRLGVSEKSQRF
jgi:hypothetical protein